MDEILALQAALQSAQDQKSSIRLSERNVVELVNKLKDLDLLDKSLLYTLNGKEYVTQSRLDAEIKREVRRSGGRVPVVDLQPILNVDVAHCERQARALAEDPANQFSLVEGELMTPSYFDAVAAEVDEELRESGVVAVGDLARRHGLSADLMSRALEERVGRVVEGRMEGGLLYTPGYVARLTAQLRGAMRAALTPTTRDALASNILSEGDDPAGAELTGSVVGELARRDDVADGAFRGGAWNPAVYTRAQTAAVAETYQRDGLVTVEQARRMGVDKPKKYFRDLDPDVVQLDASFVSRAALEQLDAAAAEVLANEGWCEAEMLMPPDLPAGDAPALFALCPVIKGGGKGKRTGTNADASPGEVRLVGDLAAATSAFLDDARERARELGAEAGREEATRRQLASASEGRGASEGPSGPSRGKGGVGRAGAAAEGDGGGGGGGGGKREKKKKGGRRGGGDSDEDEDAAAAFAITAEDLDDSDDDARGGGRKKGKKGKRGAAAGKSSANANAGADAGAGAPTGKKRTSDPDPEAGAPTEEDIAVSVSSLAPDASDAFATAVARLVRPVALRAFAAALASASSAADDRRKDARAAAAAAFEEAYPLARLFARGAEALAGDVAAARHCSDVRAVPLADAFLRSQTDADLDAFADAPSEADDASATATATATVMTRPSPPLNAKQREVAAGSLPSHARASAETLAREATSRKDPGAILRALEDTAEALGVRLKGGDKKTERSLLHAHRKGLEERLRAEEDPAAALLVAVPLIFAAGANRAVALTGRSLGPAIERVAEEGLVSEADAAILVKFHAEVVASLSGEGGETPTAESLAEAKRVALECKRRGAGGPGAGAGAGGEDE